MKYRVLGAMCAMSLLLAGCTGAQFQQDVAIGFNVGRSVICLTGGAGGNLTAKVEKAIKANNAWVGTTGDIVAASAEICTAIGGKPVAAAQ